MIQKLSFFIVSVTLAFIASLSLTSASLFSNADPTSLTSTNLPFPGSPLIKITPDTFFSHNSTRETYDIYFVVPLNLPHQSLDVASDTSFSITHPALELFVERQDACKLTHISYRESYSGDVAEPVHIVSYKDPEDYTKLTLFLNSFVFTNFRPTMTIRCNLNLSGKTLNEAYVNSSYRVDFHDPNASLVVNVSVFSDTLTFFGNALFPQPNFTLDVTPQAGFLSITEVRIGGNSDTNISGSIILTPPIVYSQTYDIRSSDVFCVSSPILLSYTVSSLSYIPPYEPSKKPPMRVNSRLMSIDYGKTQERCYSPLDGPIFTRDPIIFQVSLVVNNEYLQGAVQSPLIVKMSDPRDVAKPDPISTAWITQQVFLPGGYPLGYKSPDRSSGARDSYDKLEIGFFETVLLVRMIPDVAPGLHTTATSYSLTETGVPDLNTSYTVEYFQSFQEAVSLALYRGGLTSRRCAGLTAEKHSSSTNGIITYYPQVRCHDIDNMILAMNQIRYHTYPFLLNLLEKYGISGRVEFEYSQVPSSCVKDLERSKEGFYVFSPNHTEELCATSFFPSNDNRAPCVYHSDCFASMCNADGFCTIAFPLKESAATSFSWYFSGIRSAFFMVLFYFFLMF